MAFSRRDFLKRTCCTAAAGFAAASFNRFGLVNALAQSAQDYKALVCVFLFGGNDSNNMVVPFSSSGYASYQQIRSVLALPQDSLLPITPPSAGVIRIPSQVHGDAGVCSTRSIWRCWPTWARWCAPPPGLNFSKARPPFPRTFSRTKTSRRRCRRPRSTATDKPDGRAGRRTRFNPSMAGTFPIIISLAGTNIFCEGLAARSIESSGDPTKLLSGFGSFGGIAEPDVGAAEPADLRHRRLVDPGGQHHHHQCPAGQQGAGDCPGRGAGPGDGLPQQWIWPASSNRWRRLFRCARRWDCNGRFSSFRSAASTPTAINSTAQNRSVHPAQPGHERLLPGDGGNRRGLAGHHLHLVGLQPDLTTRTAPPEPTMPGAAIT